MQRTRLAHDLHDAHLHTGVHRAYQHIHLVPGHQLVGVVGRLGRVRFVVDGEVFDFAPAEFAAVLRHRQLETVGDRHAQLCVSTAVGQH